MTDELRQEIETLRKQFDVVSRRSWQLVERIDELENEVDILSKIVEPDEKSLDYANLTREQKIFKIRKHLVETAVASDGKAAMEYTDIRWLFDGYPSVGHTYDLMEAAGNIAGFTFKRSSDRPYRIVVNLGNVKDQTMIRIANSAKRGVA